jgi:hypothetical protein
MDCILSDMFSALAKKCTIFALREMVGEGKKAIPINSV